jgi:hypothetical protein
MKKKNIDESEIKSSADKIGQLYPILVDYYGNIIDGNHRLKANENWKRASLEHIKTEKDRLIARIVSNNVRRNVPNEEKVNTLNELGEIFLNQGLEPGRIAYEIASETGMSYRWVTKYLPDKFKDSLQSEKKRYKSVRLKRSVALCASKVGEFLDPPEGFLDFTTYRNTDFVNIRMKKCHYDKLKKKAESLGITPTKLIYNGIQFILRTKSSRSRRVEIANRLILNRPEQIRLYAQ